MDLELAIRVIGLSHLLQPPLTHRLAEQLGLRRAFESLSPLPGTVAENMAFASVALPTCSGLLVAFHADELPQGGAVLSLAVVLSAFWTWRLVRQITAIGPLLAPEARAWHGVLAAIFTVQGPLLGALLLASRL